MKAICQSGLAPGSSPSVPRARHQHGLTYRCGYLLRIPVGLATKPKAHTIQNNHLIVKGTSHFPSRK